VVALLLYAYCGGIRSSRRIEAACRTDAAFRVLANGATPDHATIARFVVDHQPAIEAVFFEVLRLCAAAGLVSVERVAIDGTKMAAAAALDQNRGAGWIRAEVARMVAEAIATDQVEDTQVGVLGFDDLPVELATSSGRRQRLDAALAQVEAQEAAESAETAKAADRAAQGRNVPGRKPKDPDAHTRLARAELDLIVAQARADQAVARRAAVVAAAAAVHGRKPRGSPPRPDVGVAAATAALAEARAAAQTVPAPATKAVANIVDPDSRIMATTQGWVQGFNCQAAVNEHHIVIAHAVTQDANDVRQYQPMVSATIAALDTIGVTDPIGMVLADAGYWSEHNATIDGPPRLIATLKDWKQRRAARALGTTTGPPPADATPAEAMEHRLRTPDGAATYTTRSHTVEPVFAASKETRGYRGFRRRGHDAASAEWSLINTIHNLNTLFAHHHHTGVPLALT
jgi:Transposase DDE domain/Transposase domain (DUF772)